MKYKIIANSTITGHVLVTDDGEKLDPSQIACLLNLLQENFDSREKQIAELMQENDELRTALECFASEVSARRRLGFCTDKIFENVNNNQICRTALSHAASRAV